MINQLSVSEWWYDRAGIITRNGISDCIKSTPPSKKRDQVWYVSEVEKWFWEIYRGSFIEKLVPCIEENIKSRKGCRIAWKIRMTNHGYSTDIPFSSFFDLRRMSGKKEKRKIIRADTGEKIKSLYNFSCNCPRHFYPTRQLLFIIIVGTGLFIILLFMTTARYR